MGLAPADPEVTRRAVQEVRPAKSLRHRGRAILGAEPYWALTHDVTSSRVKAKELRAKKARELGVASRTVVCTGP